jgi:hypothetical protein
VKQVDEMGNVVRVQTTFPFWELLSFYRRLMQFSRHVNSIFHFTVVVPAHSNLHWGRSTAAWS